MPDLVDKITPHGKDSDWASSASKLTRDMNDDVNSTQPKALQNLLLYVFSVEANWEREPGKASVKPLRQSRALMSGRIVPAVARQ